MRKKIWRRLTALLMCLCLVVAAPGQAMAETIAELEAANQRLAQEKNELETRLDELRGQEADKLAYQQALQEKINVVQEQIDTARANIDALNLRITELSLKLTRSQEEIQGTIDQFKDRLQALYKAGDVGTLEILLDSRSFRDFTMRSELVRAMTAHDQVLMDRITAYKESTAAERAECEEDKRKVAELKKQLEARQAELDALYAENAAALAEIQAAEDATESAISANAAEQAANEQRMQELIEEEKRRQEEAAKAAAAAAAAAGGAEYLGQNVSYPSGGGGVEGFNPIWPLPGVTYISAGFNGYPGHKGLDIAGSYGTPVVAAESGTVIAANNYDSWGDSWGYYVLIYHNGTFTTRYAHLSSLTVSNGQWVSQGQIVGYEGATGNVTGPHLHFEVYCNGVRVNPMIYL